MLVVQCIPATDAIPVAPCGTVGGQAMTPVVSQLGETTLTYSGAGPLFSWAVSFVLIAFVVGLTVGAIMRVIRSA